MSLCWFTPAQWQRDWRSIPANERSRSTLRAAWYGVVRRQMKKRSSSRLMPTSTAWRICVACYSTRTNSSSRIDRRGSDDGAGMALGCGLRADATVAWANVQRAEDSPLLLRMLLDLVLGKE